MTKIFISYSWDSEVHTDWVKKLADSLETYKEFHIVLDQYDLDGTIDKNYFMEKGIFDSDIIIIICTEQYAIKANNRKDGVGIETFMNVVKYWEDMETHGQSNVLLVSRENRVLSIPNYLKGKTDISFINDEKYNDNLSKLIDQIKFLIDTSTKRPLKTKSLKDKVINYFQFDRVDDILAINYKNRNLINKETDYSGKNEIKYEYWEINNLDSTSYILVLFNNVNIKDTIERFLSKHKESIPQKLVILRAVKGKNDYIQNIFSVLKINISVSEYTIEKFVWDECIDQEWKEENKVFEDDFFIDQRVMKCIDDKDETICLSLEYINNYFLKNDINKSLLMIFASGGMGKSTLSQVLTNKLNINKEQKTLLIQSEIIRSNLRKESVKNFEIKNLFQLYDIYTKMIFEHKSLLTQKQFELGVLTGKIIVIIDGLDEIVSLFHSNFNIKEFINSLTTLNKQLGKTKVIFTSRINILQNNKFLEFDNNIDLIYLKGFEEDIWKRYIDKRFSKYPNSNIYKKKVLKHLDSIFKTSKNSEVILPFFLDLISEIVEDEITNSGSSMLLETMSDEYLTNKEDIDYLIYSIFKREIKRQKINISLKEFVSFFQDLSINYAGKFTLDNLKELIEYNFSSNDINDIYNKILLNPLLKVDVDNDFVYFKYDFLVNYFHVLYLIDYLSKSNILTLEQDAIKIIAKFYDGQHTILNELVKYFSNDKVTCINSIKQIIKLASKKIITTDNSTLFKYTISSLMYLSQQMYGLNLSRDKRIEILKDIYENKKINHFYIWGEFYSLDFADLEIWSSEFHNYTLFKKCKFNNTKFFYTLFDNIKIDVKCNIKRENFDIKTCTLGDIESYLDRLENNNNKTKKNIEECFSIFIRNFFNGINFESKLDCNITIPRRINKKNNLINMLLAKDFLIKEPKLKKFYAIHSDYHRSIKNFISNGTIDSKLNQVLLLLLDI
jgi:hypothetical protein